MKGSFGSFASLCSASALTQAWVHDIMISHIRYLLSALTKLRRTQSFRPEGPKGPKGPEGPEGQGLREGLHAGGRCVQRLNAAGFPIRTIRTIRTIPGQIGLSSLPKAAGTSRARGCFLKRFSKCARCFESAQLVFSNLGKLSEVLASEFECGKFRSTCHAHV